MPCLSKQNVDQVFASDLNTLRDDVHRLVESHGEIRIEGDLRFSRVPDWLGRVEADVVFVPGSVQDRNSIISFQTTEWIRTFCLSERSDYYSN